jgi:uroporphyrinogen decarboxylase
MDDWRNFLDTTAHRRPARILYYASFAIDLRRRIQEHIGSEAINDHFGFARSETLVLNRPEGAPAPDFSRYYAKDELPDGTPIDAHGVARVHSGFYHFWGYLSPLRNAGSLKEIEDYPIEDMSGWEGPTLAEAVERAHREGKYVVGMVAHIFETSWQIRGMEQFLTDMVAQPEWAESILERIGRQAWVKATAFARAGVDMIRCGDDVASQQAMMFAPDLWRRMLHARWTRIWSEVKRINPKVQIFYHSDGNIAPIVGELVEGGVDILNPLQPECLDVDAVHRAYGKRLCFDGCIGTQSTMPFGSPQDVRDRVKEVIEKYGRDGGLFISPTHMLEPEVPIANIEAFAEACREFGEAR